MKNIFKDPDVRKFAFAFTLAFLLWIIYLIIIIMLPCLPNWNDKAYFGDMFGAISSLFSGLAMAGVIVTIMLQKQTLLLQKEELRNNTEELKGQKQQLEMQNQTMKLQLFENSFFNMLKTLNQLIGTLSGDAGGPGNKTGHLYLKSMFYSLRTTKFNSNFNANFKLTLGVNKENAFKLYDSTLENFYQNNSHNLGHYFRYIFNILKFVIESFPDENSYSLKLKYISILQSQMSNEELALLLHNSLSNYANNFEGKHCFKDILDEYKFLENIDKYFIIDEVFTTFFPKTNFKYKDTKIQI